MVKLTFYGGVCEVGGNKILLEDRGTKIFLDFGMSFQERKRFYLDPWLSPKDERGLLELGILPKVEGVYEFEDSPPEIDAVFLSHPHADHSAYASFLKKGIPLYCGETAELILRSLNETRPRYFETDISWLQFKTFRTGDKLRVGSLEVEPLHVDHSVPGSYGFIVHTSEGAIVYSGDYRLHGTKSELTVDFIDKARGCGPTAMISEGTNIVDGEVSSEPEVRDKIGRVVAETSKIVLSSFSLTDVDRLRSFYEVAIETGRYLIITMKQAYLLDRLKGDKNLGGAIPSVDDENILIFKRAKKEYHEWEEDVLKHGNVREVAEISKMQDKAILVMPFSILDEMVYIKPEPGSSFILSSSEPFNEEMEIEHEKFVNWLDHFGLPMYHIHCSGHMMPNELKRVISEIRPRRLFPIHTDYPELYAKFVKDLVSVELPVKEKPHTL